MQSPGPSLDLDRLLDDDREAAQKRDLVMELIAYLQQRQTATRAMVSESVRQAEQRAEQTQAHHASVLDRMRRIQDRLSRFHQQVDDLRTVTAALRREEQHPHGNGIIVDDTLRPDTAGPEIAPAEDSVSQDADDLHDPDVVVRPHGPALLRVQGLAKEIGGADILRDISFDVYQGEILGLIGPNGAGKTTLMECLAGLRPRTGGVFAIGNEVPASWDPRELLFYLPNNVQPFAELYTIEVLRFFGRLHEVDQHRWNQIVFGEMHLSAALPKRVNTLSKGNMQRLLIALALMSPQPLLALDEPFDGLDLHQTQAMMGILRNLREQDRTLLLCIHQLTDAQRICDRFLLLAAGRLVGVGTLAELRAQTGLSRGSLEEIFLALT
jgi:ABC-2 type transport system ATP-binding protein